jgi:hypothetical protein
MRYSDPVFFMQSKTVWVLGRCAADALFFTVQLRLASPGLLHVEKILEWTKRHGLHQENHPEVKEGEQKASEHLLWNGLFYFQY